MNTEFKILIPARFASERLPGKPLRDVAGKPLIQRVYECADASLASGVTVATDDDGIYQAVVDFGGAACMTSKDHTNGTERLAEVIECLAYADDTIILNLQGDEPLIPVALINQVAQCLEDHVFTDHHPYTDTDLGEYSDRAVLMTEKDALKCEKIAGKDWWWVDLCVELESEFTGKIIGALEEYQSDEY